MRTLNDGGRGNISYNECYFIILDSIISFLLIKPNKLNNVLSQRFSSGEEAKRHIAPSSNRVEERKRAWSRDQIFIV